MRRIVMAIALSLAVFGCGGSEDGDDNGNETGFAGSCLNEEAGLCLEYTGSVFSAAMVQGACSENATYSAARCSSEGLLGKCTVAANSTNEVATFYYQPNDASTVEAACASGSGTWSNP